MASISSRFLRIAVFASGAAALAYELIWFRLLGLYFGNTAYAISTVTAAVMIGLALGAYYGGKIGDRSGNPFRFYALIEMGIALSCAFMPFAFETLRYIYMPFHGALADTPAARLAVQFVISLLFLLGPCTLMGATIPVICSGLHRNRVEVDEVLPPLYTANLAGAACGVMVTGYCLIGTLGVQATNFTMAALNVWAGLSVWVLAGRATFSAPGRSVEVFPKPGSVEERAPSRMILLASTFLSGAAAMALEIASFRALGIAVGLSIYTVTALLFLFLAALCIGSGLVSFFRLKRDFFTLGLIQAVSGCTGALFLLTVDYLPRVYTNIFQSFPFLDEHRHFVHFLFLALFVVPIAVPFGCHFVLTSEMYIVRKRRVGEEVGSVFLSNTFGAVAGSLVAGFVLLPEFGPHGVVTAVSVAGLFAGGILLALSASRWALKGFALAGAVAVGVFFVPEMNPLWVTSGGGAHYAMGAKNYGGTIIMDEDDENSSVLLFRDIKGHNNLWVNGKPDATDYAWDMDTQTRLSYTPLLLHQSPKSVLTIGLGSGITSGTNGLFKKIGVLDSVELSEAVVRASKYFKNYGLHADPRTRIIVDDGRSFLERRSKLYDVIISEPPNPWMAGINNLFTSDFFQLARDNLAKGGIYCQWLQHYNLTPDEIRLVLRSFTSVFEEATLWRSVLSTDLLLIGAKDSFSQISRDQLAQVYDSNPRLANIFADAEKMEQWLLAGYLLEGEEMVAFGGEGPLNTDDLPLLEFSAPLSKFKSYDIEIIEGILANKHYAVPPQMKDGFEESSEIHRSLGLTLMEVGRYQEARWHFLRMPKRFENIPEDELTTLAFPVREDFDGEPGIRLDPRVGLYRPESEDTLDFYQWLAGDSLMSRISGMYHGEGTSRSNGLVIHGIPGIGESAVSVHLPVEGRAVYEVSFDYRTSRLGDGDFGVAITYFDRFEPAPGDYTKDYYDQHLLERKMILHGQVTSSWRRASFRFEANPRAKAVDLRFLIQQSPDGAWIIDNLSILRKKRHKVS